MSIAAQELDTFADDTPIELPQDAGTPVAPENPEDDTFDNGYYPEKKEEVDPDSQVKAMEDQEDEKPDPEVKKEEVKVEEKPEEEVKEEKETPKGKLLKFKDGEDTVDISPEATIKVKVKGKNEFVTLEDLKADYSGNAAWSEKIAEANQKMEESEQTASVFKEEKQELVGHLEKIAGMLDKESGDPMEALYYLLDMTGRDSNTYSKRVFDFMEEQVQTMSEMDDVEKELYWTKRKLDGLNSNQAAKAETAKSEQTRTELIQKVDRLRESQGVSEEQYVQAHKEMTKNGHENITPEMVVNYNVMKPHVEKALDLTEQFEEDLGDADMDALVHETALTLRSYPKISDHDAVSISAKKLGFDVETLDDDINELNDKVGNSRYVKNDPVKKAGRKLEENEVESFDDFDEY